MKKFFFSAAAVVFSTAVAFAQSEIRDTLEFDRVGTAGIEDILTGRLSSVRIQDGDGGLNTLRDALVRGINTLHGSSAPLFIVDGAILSSTSEEQIDMFWQDTYKGKTTYTCLSELDALNLYDIESIEILKNTTAAAIYGELGANGAIVIKTKRAKQGLGVELRSNFGTDFPGFVSHNSVALSSRNQRTDYRLSAFLRSAAVSSVPESNLSGGAAFSFNTLAGSNAELGLSARVGLGQQLSGNPAEAASDFEDKSKNIRTIESAWFNLKILNGFYWRTRFSADYQTRSRTVWYGADTQFGASVGNAAGISLASKFLATASTSLDYNRYIASDHYVGVSAGGEIYYTDSKFNTLNGTNILVSQLKAKGFGYRGSADESALFRHSLVRYGVFAQASYDYKRITGIELSVRVDHAGKYEKKWNFYPSASAYLDIRELAFGDSKAVSALRLQGGYGEAGLNRYVPYYMFSRYTEETVPEYPRDTWAFVDGWQDLRSREYNVSLNAGFIDGRISVSLGYYRRKTDDSLFLYNSGVLDVDSNLWKYGPRVTDARYDGRIVNHGVEFDFNGRLLDRENFKWDMGLNLAWNSISPKLPCPEMYGGISTTFRVYGATLDLLADGALGGGSDCLRLSRVSVGYDVPMSRVRWIGCLVPYISAGNLATSPAFEKRLLYPLRRTLMFGVKVDFMTGRASK